MVKVAKSKMALHCKVYLKHLLIVFWGVFLFASFGQEKALCITVDDLPVINYGLEDSHLNEEITSMLLKTFKKYRIPAIGYVNEGQLYVNGQLDSSKVDLLMHWLESGYELGNHTFSHMDYNTVLDSVYFDDIRKGELITRALMKEYQKDLRYFRHPFLHTGETKAKSDSLSHFLKRIGYTEAPVTIDNEDYLFAKAYHKAFVSKDTKNMKIIGESYVLYMEQKLLFFEQKSNELFKREIRQTLLIHANLLNAHYLDDLARMYKKYRYHFISQEDLLKDPAYSEPVTYFSKRGISWLFRWAHGKGMDASFVNGDIKVPSNIVDMVKKK